MTTKSNTAAVGTHSLSVCCCLVLSLIPFANYFIMPYVVPGMDEDVRKATCNNSSR